MNIISDHRDQNDSLHLQIASPVFSKSTLEQPSQLKKLPGESLKLVCSALGNPSPSMSWLHNGSPVVLGASLVLESLQASNAGNYTCLATNLAGTISREFSLTVESPKVEIPRIFRMENISARIGDESMFQCRVKSRLRPSIQLLKVAKTEGSIRLAGMNLVNVGEGETMKVGENTYVSTFVIDKVIKEDSGVYICFATNRAGGFNYQSSHLTVFPDHDNLFLPMEDNHLLLGLVVGLVFTVLLIVSFMFFYLVRTKHKLLSPESFESQRSIINQKNTLDHRDWSKRDAVIWSSIKKSAESPTCKQTGNIYDLPFSHSVRNTPSTLSQYTPIPQSINSPCSTRVSRVSSMSSSPAITPRNNRVGGNAKGNLQIVTEYQNL